MPRWHPSIRTLGMVHYSLCALRPLPATGLGFHLEALRTKLQQEPYGLLLHHAAAQLGTAVLPSQREMLQVCAGRGCLGALLVFGFDALVQHLAS